MERKAWIEPFDARILAEGLHLERHDLVGVRNGRGALVFVESGTAWITQENDRRDVIVAAGEWLRLDREGVALVQAYKAATVTITAPLDGVERAVFRPSAMARGRGTFMRTLWAVWLRSYRRNARQRRWEIWSAPQWPAAPGQPRGPSVDPIAPVRSAM
jgi:hypothetical protein